MAQKLDDSEIVSFKELLMANSIQVDAAVQLLIEKGFFSKEEFFDNRLVVFRPESPVEA
jgi:hypothetical protein